MLKPNLMNQIKDIFKSQKLAVLSTHDEDEPYCNLVAFAETEDCKSLIFSTNRDTRKYRNLLKNKRVSLLIDDRTNLGDDFSRAVAVTAMGTAGEISAQEKGDYAGLFVAKHPDIASFIKGPDNTLFRVQISDYIIAGFDSVDKLHIE